MPPTTRAFFPLEVLPPGFCVTHGANDLLFTEEGKQYIDLMSGSGTAFLGHANPAIARKLGDQLKLLLNTGAIPTRIVAEARAAVDQFFPDSHRLAALYSTGMEAVEFAIRVARHATGRRGVIGFSGAMHGKSMAAARLGWPNELATLPDFHRLAYLPDRGEDEILNEVKSTLASGSIAAVFLEPLLGSRGGHIPSRQFVKKLSEMAAEQGSLLVMDEIFTGFHRTGTPFMYHEFGVSPDLVLVGKAMGNGFPVSGVVVDTRHTIVPGMLPGSTFAGNPLAASAIVATLGEMQTSDIPTKVATIQKTIQAGLKGILDMGVSLRGKGALWVLEFETAARVKELMTRLLQRGVLVSPTANFFRLLPAATITTAHLTEACSVIRDACAATSSSGR